MHAGLDCRHDRYHIRLHRAVRTVVGTIGRPDFHGRNRRAINMVRRVTVVDMRVGDGNMMNGSRRMTMMSRHVMDATNLASIADTVGSGVTAAGLLVAAIMKSKAKIATLLCKIVLFMVSLLGWFLMRYT